MFWGSLELLVLFLCFFFFFLLFKNLFFKNMFFNGKRNIFFLKNKFFFKHDFRKTGQKIIPISPFGFFFFFNLCFSF